MYNENVRNNAPELKLHVGYGEQRLGLVAPMHYHSELEFLTVESGEFTVQTEKSSVVMQKGDVVFINTRVPHSTSCAVPGTVSGLIQMRERDFHSVPDDNLIKYSLRLHTVSEEPAILIRDPEIFGICKQIITETRAKKNSYRTIVQGLVLCLLGRLAREGYLADAENLTCKKEVAKILPALSYVNEHYAEDISLSEISAKLGFDTSYFCRIFKEATGATFVEYLNFVRICKAEKLLSQTEDSILCVASSVGLCSVSYFNRIFKRYHGISPRQFRTLAYKSGV